MDTHTPVSEEVRPPSPEEVRKHLESLSHAEVTALAAESGVPFTTLWKIRQGDTPNPRLKTVHDLWPELQRRATKSKEAA